MKKHYYKKSSTKITLSTNVFVKYYLSCINKYIVYIKLPLTGIEPVYIEL